MLRVTFPHVYTTGIALHFVQDAHIPSPRTKFRRRIHAALERKMDYFPVPGEEATLQVFRLNNVRADVKENNQ